VANTGLPYFPQIIAPNTVIGRLASGAGPAEAIPFAALAASLGLSQGGVPVTPGAAFTEVTISSDQSVHSTNTGTNYVATAALTLTLDASGNLGGATWGISIFALGGNVTIAIDAGDALNGGAVGIGTVVPKGYFATLSTDGAGNIYIEMGQAMRPSVSLSSGSTTDLGTAASRVVTITGTTTISSLGSTAQDGEFYLVTFSGVLTLTYNATSLILPGAANITTAAGNTALFLCLGNGNWRCMFFSPPPGTGPSVTAGVLLRIDSKVTSGSYSFSAPASANVALVKEVGGGGHGANGSISAGGGGGAGGSGGGYAEKWYANPATISGTVGSAAAATTATDGTTTITANGGANNGGAAGTATNGDINISGQQGEGSQGNGYSGGQGGGNAMFGSGGFGGGQDANPGHAANFPGTGGGGGGSSSGVGAAGAPGAVFVYWFK
jgi:hypothetical protein